MTSVSQTLPANVEGPASAVQQTGPQTGTQTVPAGTPAGWRELRQNADIQFEPVATITPEPSEPGWFERALVSLFQWLGDLLSPLGQALGIGWPVFQWILLGLLVAFVIYMAVRTIGPVSWRRGTAKERAQAAQSEPDWAPTQQESVALLEDADRLASEGRYDEATHLLLRRSVTQISQARPDWVEVSSTARELAALPELSAPARAAFAAITQRVETSLFALRSLSREDWDIARKAYADFAGLRIEGDGADPQPPEMRSFGRKVAA